MKKQHSKPEDTARLRQKAEEKLKRKKSQTNKNVSEPDNLKLIHELEVHQIELEMQNEELVIAKEKAELAEEKYTELYDFAPSSYLTISKEGEILDLNLAAARMLGKERSKLLKNRFALFLSQETLPVFNLFFQNVFTSNTKQSCEAIIASEGNLPIYVTIEGIVSQNDEFCLLTLTDTTEKNRAKKELQSSEEKYRISEFDLKKAQQIAHLGNWTLNIETNELFWSDEIYRIFGCEPQEFESTHEAFLGFIHPDDREKFNAAYLKSLDTKTEYQIEHRIITKNNQIKYVKEKCTTTFNEQGKPLNSFGIVIDFTEQKTFENELIKAKEKAEESESKLRAALESMSDAVFISDTDGDFLDFNDAFATFHKFKNKQECAKTFKEYPLFLDVYFPNGVLATLEQWVVPSALRGEMGINKEFTLLRRDTNETWIGSYNYAPIRNNEGHIIGSVVACRDITDSKKAQLELIATKEKAEESEARYRTLFENMNTGFVLFEVVENEQGIPIDLIILAANEGFEKTTGLNLKDAVGMHLTKVLPGIEKDEADWIGTYSKVAHTRESTQFEQGSELLGYYYSISAFYAGPKQCAVTFQDITERKQAEKALLAKMDELERFHKLTVGREITMVELKKEVNNLLKKLGEDPKYKIVE